MTARMRAEVFYHAPKELFSALFKAFIVTALIGWAWNQNSAIAAYFVPSTYWISNTAIIIPDHEVGDDPLVTFERTIRRRFVGGYISEFRIASGGAREVCATTGTARYEPQEESKWVGLLSVYTGGCTIPPGCWIADTTIEFPVWGNATKETHVISEPFAVTSGDAVPNPCEGMRS